MVVVSRSNERDTDVKCFEESCTLNRDTCVERLILKPYEGSPYTLKPHCPPKEL